MILIAFGANLASPVHGSPQKICLTALGTLEKAGVQVSARSHLYESAPVPASDQPWFVNGVAALETDLTPGALLELLHEIETAFGRVRAHRNEARVLDFDLIDYDGQVSEHPHLPHPRMQDRAFVLLPLRDIAPHWAHPVTGDTLDALIATLPGDQTCRAVGEGLVGGSFVLA